MEDRFLKYIAAFALVGFCAYAATMVAAVIGTHQPGLHNFLNWPALGPLASAAAVAVALYIAIVGWRKNAEDRRADFRLEQEQKKQETKEVASGAARILYMELEEASWGIIRFVQKLCEDKHRPPAINFCECKNIHQGVRQQYEGMHMRAEEVIQGNVLRKEDLAQTNSLFRFSITLGDKYIGAVQKYRAFIVNISEHLQANIVISDLLNPTRENKLNRRLNAQTQVFNQQPYTAKFYFYTQVKIAIDTLKLLEDFRVAIPTCPERDQTFDRWAKVVEAELIRCNVFEQDTVKGKPMSNERYLSTLDSFGEFLCEKVKKYEDEMNATLFKHRD